MTDLKPNAELAYRVLDHIDAHPASWNQSEWVCGSAACFAGWAVKLSGGVMVESTDADVIEGPAELVGKTAERAAYRVLGITEAQAGWPLSAEWLFDGDNTREDLGRLVAGIFGPRPAVTP